MSDKDGRIVSSSCLVAVDIISCLAHWPELCLSDIGSAETSAAQKKEIDELRAAALRRYLNEFTVVSYNIAPCCAAILGINLHFYHVSLEYELPALTSDTE